MSFSFDQMPLQAFRFLRVNPFVAGEQIRLFETSVISNNRPVLFGADRGRDYMLLAVPDNYECSQFNLPRGFKIGVVELNMGTKAVGGYFYISAIRGLVDPELFSSLLMRIEKSLVDGLDIATVVGDTLNSWRAMLDIKTAVVPLRQLTGIFGELTVVQAMLRNLQFETLDFWRGPEMSRTDFYFEHVRLEVKTSVSSGPRKATISSLAQLEPVPGKSLHLLHLQMKWDPAGKSIGELVEEIGNHSPEHLSELHAKLQLLGFEISDLEDFADIRWSPVRKSLYLVDSDFPKLTSELLSQNVPNYSHFEGATYRIFLEGLKVDDISDAFEQRIAELVVA